MTTCRLGQLAAPLLAAGLVLGIALAASAQRAEEEEEMQMGGGSGESPAGVGASDIEPWYTPRPNLGGNVADQLKTRVATMQDGPVKQRITCYLDKIRNADTDDRVIWWTRICPTYQNDGTTEEVCGIGDFNEEDLYEQIRRPEDVETADRKLHLFTYLKAVAFELQSHLGRPQDQRVVVEELQRTDRDVQLALEELAKIQQAPSDGSDSQRHYLAIRAWIQRKQADPKSVYSCR